MNDTQNNEVEDFGFTFVDHNEQIQTHVDEKDDLLRRLDQIGRLITPFLDNLCRDPEKSTIHWPNRVEKITDFKKKLLSIIEGKAI